MGRMRSGSPVGHANNPTHNAPATGERGIARSLRAGPAAGRRGQGARLGRTRPRLRRGRSIGPVHCVPVLCWSVRVPAHAARGASLDEEARERAGPRRHATRVRGPRPRRAVGLTASRRRTLHPVGITCPAWWAPTQTHPSPPKAARGVAPARGRGAAAGQPARPATRPLRQTRRRTGRVLLLLLLLLLGGGGRKRRKGRQWCLSEAAGPGGGRAGLGLRRRRARR
jgi:hypothetical protein